MIKVYLDKEHLIIDTGTVLYEIDRSDLFVTRSVNDANTYEFFKGFKQIFRATVSILEDFNSVAYTNATFEDFYRSIKKKEPEDFYLEVSKGNIQNTTRVNKSGHNVDIDTGTDPEDIWDISGLWVAPTAPRIHAIVSDNANDTNAGTGARTVYVQGLDQNYDLAFETIILNGLTPVNTVKTYTIIDYMVILTVGSTGTAQGIISATAATDLTVTAQINIGDNQTHMAIAQIPRNTSAYLNNFSCSMSQQTAGASCEIHLITKTATGPYVVRRVIYLNNSGNSHQLVSITPPLKITEKSIIKIQVFSVTSNNTSVEAGFDLTLVQD